MMIPFCQCIIIVLMSCVSRACCLHVGFVFSISSLFMTLCSVFFLQIAISQTNDQIAMYSSLALTAGCRSLCEDEYSIETNITKCCNSLAFTDCKEKQVCKEELLARSRELQSTQQNEMYVLLTVSGVITLVIPVLLVFKRREKRRRQRENLINQGQLNQRLLMFVQRMRMRGVEKRKAAERAHLLQSFLHTDSEQNVCGICLNVFEAEKAIRLQCEHVFHSQCLRNWLAVNDSCPFCRLKAEP